MPYGKVAPEFLYFKTTPNDGSPIEAVDAITGAPIGPSDLFPRQTSRAKPDSIVTIDAIGFGDVVPSIYQGQPALVASKVVAPAKVRRLDVSTFRLYRRNRINVDRILDQLARNGD